MPRRIAAHLRFHLGLSEEQTRQVEAILHQRQAALQVIRREVQPRVMAELDQVEAEIAAVLDDSQREHWHLMFARLRNTWVPPLPEKAKEGQQPRRFHPVAGGAEDGAEGEKGPFPSRD